jgi:hypothetical protein
VSPRPSSEGRSIGKMASFLGTTETNLLGLFEVAGKNTFFPILYHK